MPARDDDLDLLITAAQDSAAIAMLYFKRQIQIWDKGSDLGPVTEADLAVNQHLKTTLMAARPDYGWLSEETPDDTQRLGKDTVFILDPIDGTRAFISGLPLWTTLIGLRQNGVPTIGVVGQPYIGEIFIGGPSGAYLLTRDGGQTPIATRKCATLEDAVAATTDADIFQGTDRQGWERLKSSVRLARYGCDAYAYAMLAAGRIDVVAESELKVWDWSALMPLVKAAGGAFTGWDGQAPTAADGRVLALGDARLSAAALAHLNGQGNL